MNKRLRSDSERGFTIIEVMVAITLLLIAVLGVATMADGANVVSTTTKARVGATNLARELLEDARSFKYTDLSGNVPAGGSNTSLQDSYASIGITDARPSITGFQVSRRGIVYTVNLFSCVFDDSHDGARPSPGAGNPDVNAAGPYCLGSATAGSSGSSSDANPDDARKLEASVSWTFRGAVPNCKGANQTTASGATGGVGLACVTQSELIANPTGGLGPTILTLTNAPAGTVESGINSVVMNATTVSTAQSLTWSADDGSNGTAGPAAGDTDGTHWTFTWTLGSSSPADGTHLITAQAFLLNAGGVPKQAAVNLNRFIPATPQVTAGGVDSRKTTEPAAAVNWLANADNDILGYTVYRAKPTAFATTTPNVTVDTPVCSTASVGGTSCFDAPGGLPKDLHSFATNAACPPAQQAAGDECVNYYVVPFDQMWTTGNLTHLGSTECGAGFPWASGGVDVPAAPVAPSHSVPPLTNSPLWSTARAGCPSAFITVDYTTGILNTPPAAPTPAATQCTTDNGQPVISWVAPTSPDGGNPPNDPSDAVQSFRIYRDPPGTSPDYNDPATTINYASGTVSFKDPNPTGGTDHTYYVTAVDGRFQESQPLPITWSAGACP